MQSRKALRFAIFVSLTLSLILAACAAPDTQGKSSNGSAADATGHSSAPTENKDANTDIDNTAIPSDPPVHIHKFSAATCTSPRICACGETEGDPADVPGKINYHGHVYTSGSSSKKYHYEAAYHGKNSHEITWDEVTSRGLEPCGTCVLK